MKERYKNHRIKKTTSPLRSILFENQVLGAMPGSEPSERSNTSSFSQAHSLSGMGVQHENKCQRGNWILELPPQKEVPEYSEVRQETTTLHLLGVLDSRLRTDGCPHTSLRVPETDLLCYGPHPTPKDTCAGTEGRSCPHALIFSVN